MTASVRPLACVIGTIDLVRPLGLAGIPVAVVAPPAAVVRYSRFTSAVVEWADPWKEPELLLDRLMQFGSEQAERPVLYYEGDWDLLFVSRRRDRLRDAFRFIIADAELVEDLVDKARFLALARRLDLPVPTSRHLIPGATRGVDLDLPFPVVLKPLTRQNETWGPIGHGAKALQVDNRQQLEQVLQVLAEGGNEVLAQELIPGPETLVESYHAYVDAVGDVVGEFAGRKVRTYPPIYGDSTAVEITDSQDVVELGRDLVRRLGVTGVLKLDFKRDQAGRLRLLEVNPRFTLWHHVGARAGVNLPALVYSDLTGLPRPPVREAQPGVRWCYHLRDARAALAGGHSLVRWLPWALTSEAKSVVSLSDPLPVIQGSLAKTIRAATRSLRPRAR